MLIKNGLVFTKDFKFEKKDILIKDEIIEKVDDFIKADNSRYLLALHHHQKAVQKV